jgi:hypothetical protein
MDGDSGAMFIICNKWGFPMTYPAGRGGASRWGENAGLSIHDFFNLHRVSSNYIAEKLRQRLLFHPFKP